MEYLVYALPAVAVLILTVLCIKWWGEPDAERVIVVSIYEPNARNPRAPWPRDRS